MGVETVLVLAMVAMVVAAPVPGVECVHTNAAFNFNFFEAMNFLS